MSQQSDEGLMVEFYPDPQSDRIYLIIGTRSVSYRYNKALRFYVCAHKVKTGFVGFGGITVRIA